MKPRLRILFAGMIAADPFQGGATWAVLQYLLGFRQLGHEVYFVEPIKQSALRPMGVGLAASENATYFRQVMRDFGFDGNASLLLADSQESIGIEYEELRNI